MINLTNQQARQFLLLKQGLIGEYKFVNKQGAFDYVRQAGCLQFDPVDLCGKNAEITLQSRIKGFTKKMFFELLYQDRLLFDYLDKQLAIIPTADWPYFERFRLTAYHSGLRFDGLKALENEAKAYIAENGPVSSDDLPLAGEIHWQSAIHWSGNWHGLTKASRAVLEQLYSTGELIIHRRKGSRKYYDLAEKYIPAEILNAPDPITNDFEHFKWRILRRIGAIGLLWNRPSDAWLNIRGLDTANRNMVFEVLVSENKITPVIIDGHRNPFYFRTEDMPLIEAVLNGAVSTNVKPRCELIAVLDPFMWDRKLIKALFGFEFAWEIYTPPAKRKYGAYVLPLLYGERFIGRVEVVCDRKAGIMTVKNIWYEEGVKPTKKLQGVVDGCLKRFAKFNECIDTIHGHLN
ncbi:MAG: winged helix DNA-binding domain-containing protein [Lachnospiraceae bacterium]|nr:winged helix DNA-binding domain-containing protein [Lachnospiraceae bacterium]